MDVKAALTNKIGGIPVVVIAAVAVGGVVLLSRGRGGGTTAAAATVTDAASGDSVDSADYAAAQQPVFVANTPTVTTTYSEDTNDKWLRRSLEWLIGQGVREDFARNSLTKYLNGEDLTATEAQIKDKAVKQFSLPPTLPSSGAVLATKPVYYTTGKGDVRKKPLDLARAYHPTANPTDALNQLLTLNPGLNRNAYLRPGQKIRVA